ncbi:MAG: phosphonoacetate hydrolase [Pseudomonadota bacterium]
MITVNEREYPNSEDPIIVICIDGCEPDYFDQAISAGFMPNLQRIKQIGTTRLAHCVIPSFTNPNNMSIATGQHTEVHGICGNFLLDPQTGEEVMMNDPKFLRAGTVFAGWQAAGKSVAIVTAKDKLRALLGHGLVMDDGKTWCFSAEKSDTTTKKDHGIDNAAQWLGRPVPEVYSAELSEFVFASGVKLMQERRVDILYLTTTDYVQHKHAPGTGPANDFYAMFDSYLGQLDATGVRIVITADHGMKPKHDANGQPNVTYLQDLLDQKFAPDATRVILPITDPYVVHHGALGSFATIYVYTGAQIDDVRAYLEKAGDFEGIYTKDAAQEKFHLPIDRIGDIVIVGTKNQVLGTSHARHDLTQLKEPLRSHGGISEQTIPFIINRNAPQIPEAPHLHNYDAFFWAAQVEHRND